MITVIICVLLALLLGGLDFLVAAALVKLASMIFGFVFTWYIAIFVWLVILVLEAIFGKGGK